MSQELCDQQKCLGSEISGNLPREKLPSSQAPHVSNKCSRSQVRITGMTHQARSRKRCQGRAYVEGGLGQRAARVARGGSGWGSWAELVDWSARSRRSDGVADQR